MQDIEYNAEAKSRQPSGGGACESACIPVLVNICEALRASSDKLNEYDGVCGDGDCGRGVQERCRIHLLDSKLCCDDLFLLYLQESCLSVHI